MLLKFWKMTGAGNDFIAIDNRAGVLPPDGPERAELVRKLCIRRIGVGADGLMAIEPSSDCDFRMRFYNCDGGEAETCGNAARCIARFANLLGIAGEHVQYETLAGIYSAVVQPDKVRVSMSDAHSLQMQILLETDAGFTGIVHFVNTGVPHAVHVVHDIESVPIREWGPAVRYHSRFAPAGANFNVIVPTGNDRLIIRTYERGVEDETLACGTGCIASAIIAGKLGLAKSPVTLTTRSGVDLTVYYTPTSTGATDVQLEGEARVVYRAETDI
jgi:diaminopimelate epimerase